jgi:PAS domain S-box-containing protein
MPDKSKKIKELEQRVAQLEAKLVRAHKIEQRLQQAERIGLEKQQRMFKLSKEIHLFRATVGMPELYLDGRWRVVGYSGNFAPLTKSVVEFADRKRHIRDFLQPGDFKKIEDHLRRVETLRDLPYENGRRWCLRYKGPNSKERIGKEWIAFRTTDVNNWRIAEENGVVKIIHNQHFEDKQDCYLIAAREYGGPEEDIKISYKIKTSKNENLIKDLSLIISAGSGHEETLPDLVGYTICTGSCDNTAAFIQRQGADLVTIDESLEPDTEYQVIVERIGGRIRRKLKNLHTGKLASELELIDSNAIFDFQNHLGFTSFSGEAEFFEIKIYTRKSLFNIDQFKIPFDIEVGIREKALQGRFFRLRLGVMENDGVLFNSLLFEDITERKRAEEALRKASEELEQRVNERTAELAIINKELRMETLERKRALEALRESENKYKTLAEHTNDIVYSVTAEGVFTYISPQIERYGYDPEEIIGFTVQECIYPEDIEPALADFQRTAETGEEFPTQFRIVDKQGGIHWVEEYGRVIRDDEGNFNGLTGVLRDISQRKKVEEELQKHRDSLEDLVKERTAELTRANQLLEKEILVRKRTEKALRKSEESYRTVVETMKEGLVVVDDNLKLTFVNDALCRITGFTKEELLRSNALVFLDEKYQDVAKEHFQKRQKGDTDAYELVIDGKDERQIHLLISPHPLSDEKGQFRGTVAVVTDITERKRAEAALRKRAEFEFLITTISTKFINLGPEEIDQGIEQALKAIGEFDGVDRSGLFLRSDDGTKVSNTHEWCADGIEPRIEELKELQIETFSWWADRFLNKREAVHIPRVDDLPPEAEAEKEILLAQAIVSLIAVPIVYRDSVVGFLGFCTVSKEKSWEDESIVFLRMVGEIFINALERTRMEEELRKERDSLEVRVAQSTAALRRSELRLQERLRELTCFYKIRDEFDREQKLEETLYSCASHIRNALNEPEKKVILINLDGHQIIIEDCKYSKENNLESLIQIGGVNRGFLRIFSCINETGGFLPFEWDLVKHAGASLASLIQNRELREQLIQSEKMAAAGRLAAGVAHEINNPLGSIKNSLFILKKSISAKHPDRSYLDLMDSEIDRVTGIITQLYNLYKPSAREVQQVNLADAVGNVLKMLEPQISRRKIDVQNEMGKNGAKLKLSVNQVTQVLYNVILNAAQAMPHGGRLTIGCTKSTGRLELWVNDTGPGIADDVLPHIFEPFFSTKTKGSSQAEGMGMGLPLSRSIMETLGGKIAVKTKAGWGSTFIISFPTKPLKREKDESK